MTAVLRDAVQKPYNQTEKRPGSHTQQNTRKGLFAHDRRKNRIPRRHIKGRSLPHGRDAKHCAHNCGILRSQNTPGYHDRNIDKGKEDRRNVHVSDEGERHEKFDGNQYPEQIVIVLNLTIPPLSENSIFISPLTIIIL